MAASAATNPVGPHEAAEVVAGLYQAYADRLTRYCRGLLGSGQEAEDAVQTTFVRAVQALRNGVVPECESAWLYTIAKNVCLSQRRSTTDRARHTTDVELETISAPEESDDDLAHDLNAALAALPERQRRALFLREWLGLSSREVAGRLGMRPPETYALLTRARQAMATALTVSTGRTTVAINLGSLLVKLRALLFGGAAKTATTAAVVVAVTVGGAVVAERAADPGQGVAPTVRVGVVHSPTAPAKQPGRRVSADPSAAATAHPAVPRPVRPSLSVGSRSPIAPTTEDQQPSPASVPEPESPSAATPTGAPARPTATSPAPPTTPAVPKVDLARTRTQIERFVPPELAGLLPPVDETVGELVPPEVTQVVESVDETLSSVTGLLPPPPPPPLP